MTGLHRGRPELGKSHEAGDPQPFWVSAPQDERASRLLGAHELGKRYDCGSSYIAGLYLIRDVGKDRESELWHAAVRR